MRFIWATRGRTWGFTFLATAGMQDPLVAYERVTSSLEGASRGIVRAGDVVALKFRDPDGRLDRSGRPIPHTFVLYDELAVRVGTVEDGIREVWPLVADEYARVWDLSEAPAPLG